MLIFVVVVVVSTSVSLTTPHHSTTVWLINSHEKTAQFSIRKSDYHRSPELPEAGTDWAGCWSLEAVREVRRSVWASSSSSSSSSMAECNISAYYINIIHELSIYSHWLLHTKMMMLYIIFKSSFHVWYMIQIYLIHWLSPTVNKMTSHCTFHRVSSSLCLVKTIL